MIAEKFIVLIACLLLHTHTSTGWSCVSDEECTDISGSVCAAGVCACPLGQQRVDGGTRCADVAPYYSSPCVEDHQCSGLFPGYQCRGDTDRVCRCQLDHHYYLGRCWRSRQLGEACEQDEECQGRLRDPNAMACEGTCVCAEGYYLRQRGECRKIAFAIGDECVLDADCQFEGGLCSRMTLTCYSADAAASEQQTTNPNIVTPRTNTTTRSHTTPCGGGVACADPLVCSAHGVCVCPLGYYLGDDGSCLAELGSPATAASCAGLLAELRGGACACPDNFYYDENMRDCVKPMVRFTDSCISDEMCHSFGAESSCGPPAGPWGLRACACTEGAAVFDEAQNMCRLFSGIGEPCEVNSDCLAGNVEIVCAGAAGGGGVCACPAGLAAVDGLCLTAGLALGDACQVSQECGADNSVCSAGVCACDASGYQQEGDFCAPAIGGACAQDTDCVIEGTVCVGETCQCGPGVTEFEDACWPVQEQFNGSCVVSAQCVAGLGAGAACGAGACACADTHHYRGGGCWPRTGIFEPCTRNVECYLGDITERLVCRNGLCQCHFEHPYVEQLHTCSSATAVFGNLITLLSALLFLLSHQS